MHSTTPATRQVAILLYPDVEVLNFAGPCEVFTTASRMALRLAPAAAPQAEITASVCTGVFLLAAAGLLPAGTPVTTHGEDNGDPRRAHPGLDVLPQRRCVDQGQIVSSAGISAGIDMRLHLVARLAGMALAERTAR